MFENQDLQQQRKQNIAVEPIAQQKETDAQIEKKKQEQQQKLKEEAQPALVY